MTGRSHRHEPHGRWHRRFAELSLQEFASCHADRDGGLFQRPDPVGLVGDSGGENRQRFATHHIGIVMRLDIDNGHFGGAVAERLADAGLGDAVVMPRDKDRQADTCTKIL